MGGGESKVEGSEEASGKTESAPEEKETPYAKVLLSQGLVRDLEHRLVEQVQVQQQNQQQVPHDLGETEVDMTQNFRLLGEQVDLSPLVEEFDLTGDAEAAMDVLQNSAGCENPILRGGGACEADEAACIACLNDSSMSPSQCASFVRALEICASQQVKLRSDPLLQ
eukprot:119102_1